MSHAGHQTFRRLTTGMSEHLVIVGGSAAGARAAQTALASAGAPRVDLISEDADAPYYRPALSKQLLRREWSHGALHNRSGPRHG